MRELRSTGFCLARPLGPPSAFTNGFLFDLMVSRTGNLNIILDRGTTARLTRIAFQVAPSADLKEMAKALGDQGIAASVGDAGLPGIGKLLSFSDPKDTGPNEIQGSGIKGGVKHDVAPGDIIEIPPGVPHQFFLAPGTQITYLVVKVVKH